MFDIDTEIDKAAAYFRKNAQERGVKPRSCIVVVLDHGGGRRYVVTPRRNVKNHIGKNERGVIVPKIRIAEPVEGNNIPGIISLADRYATLKLSGDA